MDQIRLEDFKIDFENKETEDFLKEATGELDTITTVRTIVTKVTCKATCTCNCTAACTAFCG